MLSDGVLLQSIVLVLSKEMLLLLPGDRWIVVVTWICIAVVGYLLKYSLVVRFTIVKVKYYFFEYFFSCMCHHSFITSVSNLYDHIKVIIYISSNYIISFTNCYMLLIPILVLLSAT